MWLSHVLMHFISYYSGPIDSSQAESLLERKFAEIQMQRIIELILEFPKSKQSIMELKLVIDN